MTMLTIPVNSTLCTIWTYPRSNSDVAGDVALTVQGRNDVPRLCIINAEPPKGMPASKHTEWWMSQPWEEWIDAVHSVLPQTRAGIYNYAKPPPGHEMAGYVKMLAVLPLRKIGAFVSDCYQTSDESNRLKRLDTNRRWADALRKFRSSQAQRIVGVFTPTELGELYTPLLPLNKIAQTVRDHKGIIESRTVWDQFARIACRSCKPASDPQYDPDIIKWLNQNMPGGGWYYRLWSRRDAFVRTVGVG